MSSTTDNLIGLVPIVMGAKIVENLLEDKPKRRKRNDFFKGNRW